MATLGYDFVAQDRSKAKFTIANVTFFRTSKLRHYWTDSRSRALLTAFTLASDAPAAAVPAAAEANRGAGPSSTGSASDVSDEEPGGSRGTVPGPRCVYVANLHLEGHPYKSKERISQMKNVTARLQWHIESQLRSAEAARIAIVGACPLPDQCCAAPSSVQPALPPAARATRLHHVLQCMSVGPVPSYARPLGQARGLCSKHVPRLI